MACDSTELGALKRLTVRERLDGCDILQIYPSRRLGLPIVGTLFFSKQKSEQLLLRGYQDTKAALEHRATRAANYENNLAYLRISSPSYIQWSCVNTVRFMLLCRYLVFFRARRLCLRSS